MDPRDVHSVLSAASIGLIESGECRQTRKAMSRIAARYGITVIVEETDFDGKPLAEPCYRYVRPKV